MPGKAVMCNCTYSDNQDYENNATDRNTMKKLLNEIRRTTPPEGVGGGTLQFSMNTI
jgi:hypothetical protein